MAALTDSEDNEDRSVWMLGPSKNDFRHMRCTMKGLYDAVDTTGKITILAGEHEDKGVLGIVAKNGTAAANEWNRAYTGVICIVSQDASVDLTESDAMAVAETYCAGMTVWVYPKSIREPARGILVSAAQSVRELCEMFCGVTRRGKNRKYTAIFCTEDTSGTQLVVMGRTRGLEEEKSDWIEGLYGSIVVCKGEKKDGHIELTEAPEATVRACMLDLLTQTPLAD